MVCTYASCPTGSGPHSFSSGNRYSSEVDHVPSMAHMRHQKREVHIRSGSGEDPLKEMCPSQAVRAPYYFEKGTFWAQGTFLPGHVGVKRLHTWDCLSQEQVCQNHGIVGVSKLLLSGPDLQQAFVNELVLEQSPSHSLPCNLCLFSWHNVELCSCNGDLMVSIATEVAGPFTEKVCWPPW